MGVVYILLFMQGITGQMVLYQPQNSMSMDVNSTAVITCVPSENSIGIKFSWYKKWRSDHDPVRVKSCVKDNDAHKYGCKHEKYMASLEIYNAQITDSGVYYCAYHYTRFSLKFGNGTNLNVGDRSTSRSSIHILHHLKRHHPHSALHLACVVLVARNTVHLYWNISGTYHKGRIVSTKESDGTWTVMNFISLSKDTWNHREKVTCEAWLQSSPISVHWEISGQDELQGHVVSKCQTFLIPAVTAGALLVLMVSVYLFWTFKLTDNKTPDLMEKISVTEEEITYSELNINRKQPAQ